MFPAFVEFLDWRNQPIARRINALRRVIGSTKDSHVAGVSVECRRQSARRVAEHARNWGNVRSWTGILAPGLTKRNTLDALKKRHCYSTLDRNCELSFEVNGATMGDIADEPAKTIKATVTVEDPDDGDSIAKIELFEDGKIVQTDEPKSTRRTWTTVCSPQPGPHYYFVRITQADGNLLWSAPVWVTVIGN